MFDLFTTWSRMADAAVLMGRTAQQVQESWSAVSSVIGARTAIAERAMVAPHLGDQAELGRILPEKIQAFSKASAAVAGEWLSANAAFWSEAQYIGGMMLKGRALTMDEWSTLTARNAAYALRTMDNIAQAASGAVTPVHRTVTANARRLARPRAR